MAKKKKKSVLDYDPLAWLNESESENTAPKKVKQVAEAAAEQKEPMKEKPSVEETEEDGFGFFATEDDYKSNDETESDDGFGFFADDDNETIEADTEDGDGFGFFTNDANTVEKEEIEEDEGFGFFSNEDDNEVVDTVNTETLDMNKEDAVNLGSELTIKTASVIKAEIDALLSNDADIVLNAEEMIKIDTAGLQLLHSLKESLAQTGHHIKWIGTSTVINESAEMIGMPILAPKSKDACYGFFEENMKDADDGSSGFF